MPDQKIPRRVITALAAGEMTLAAAISETGLQKNALFRALAKGVLSGEYPDSILKFRSVESVYETLNEAAINPSDAETEAVKLRRRLKEAQAKAREAERSRAESDRFSAFLESLAAEPVNPPQWCTDNIDRHLGGTPSVPILCFGDWHFGEVVRPAEAGGYGYDSDIAEMRIEETIRKTVDLSKDHLSGLTYPGIVLALIGDMTSGALHPELAESDEHTIFEAIHRALELLISSVDTLKSEFGQVFIPTTVGNHGRAFDRKPRAKGYAKRNHDWHLYCLLARHYRDDPDVQVMIPDSGESHFSVYGTRFLLTHGDQIGAKGGDGFIGALGPISRGSMKTEASLSSLGQAFDHMICGHYHQHLALPRVTVNGALKGPDEYALRLLRVKAEDPSQTLLVVHPDHGLTFRIPIYLRDASCPDRSGMSGKWVEVFSAAC